MRRNRGFHHRVDSKADGHLRPMNMPDGQRLGALYSEKNESRSVPPFGFHGISLVAQKKTVSHRLALPSTVVLRIA
jgi:hypothetical protein